MSLDTLTTKQVSDNIVAQLEATLNQTFSLLPRSFVQVLANALAAVIVLLYKYGGFIFLQLFVQTASFKDTEVNGEIINPLKFWGRLIGVGDPKGGEQAELLVDIPVNTQSGTLAANQQFVRGSTGVTYITTAAVLLDAPVVQAVVKAVQDQTDGGGVGTIGNLEPGDTISAVNAPAAIATTATVVSQVTTGANPESEAAYRQRVLDRWQKRLQGGAYSDYEAWSETVPGIVNAYPYTGDPGEVDVYVEATVESSGNPDGIPTNAQLEDVLEAINVDDNGLASRRNANAFPNVFPITRTYFDVTVTGIQGVDDLAQVRSDIEDGLQDLFATYEPFIPGLSVPPRLDQITQTRIASIVEDVVTAAGGTFSSATFALNSGGATIPLYVLGEGEKSRVININFL